MISRKPRRTDFVIDCVKWNEYNVRYTDPTTHAEYKACLKGRKKATIAQMADCAAPRENDLNELINVILNSK